MADKSGFQPKQQATGFSRWLLTFGCVPGDLLTDGCLDTSNPDTDGRNTVMFNRSPPGGFPVGTMGFARVGTRSIGGSVAPRPGSSIRASRYIVSADIYVGNFLWGTYRDGDNCDPDVGFIERLLAHEIGHALGLDHNPLGHGFNIMAQYDSNPCQGTLRTSPAGIMEKDRKLLRAYYGPFDSINVEVARPIDGAKIFPSTTIAFEALIGSRSESSPDATESLITTWEVDGREVASGNIAHIDSSEMIPGAQEVRAVVRDQRGTVLGSSSVVIEKVTDLLVGQDFVVWPIPCINLAGSADQRCLMRLRERWYTYACSLPVGFGYRHEVQASDLLSNQIFSVIEPTYFNSPFGPGCRDQTSYDLFFGIRATSQSEIMLLQFSHGIYRFGSFVGSNTVTGLVYKTDPVLEHIDIDDSCEIEDDGQRCAITVVWDGHYFAPSSALFFRRNTGDSWKKIADLGMQSGSIRTEPIIPFSGAQLAVYQYGLDFKIPNGGGFGGTLGYNTLIRAPAGLMAGPVDIDGVVQTSPGAIPRSGHWGSVLRDGTGINISRSSNGMTLVIWYTYDSAGNSIWYISKPAIEKDGLFISQLEKMTWKKTTQSTRRTVVGSISYLAIDDTRLVLDVELDDGANSQSASVAMTHRIGGEFPSGLWNEPSLKGWGFNVNSQQGSAIEQNFIVSITYRSNGQPRWEIGQISGPLLMPTTIAMSEVQRRVSCATCGPVQYELDSAAVGNLSVEFSGTATGWINIVGRKGGAWVRGAENNPVIFQPITLRNAESDFL